MTEIIKERPLSIAISCLVNENKILLIKRVKGDFINLWGLPGGKVEKDEFLSQAAIREILEETAIESEFKEHLAVVSEHIIENNTRKHFVLHVCELTPKTTDAKIQHEGEVQWFDLEKIHELKDKIIPSDFVMLEKIIKNREKTYFNSLIEKSDDNYKLISFE